MKSCCQLILFLVLFVLLSADFIGLVKALSASTPGKNVPQSSGRRPRIPTSPERRWEIRPIGKVESIYKDKFGTPKQATISSAAGGKTRGRLLIFEEFRECLADLSGFDYLWALSLMHLNDGYKVRIKPLPRQNQAEIPEEVGLFSCRAPHRPNPIAMSALEIVSIDVNLGIVEVLGLDLLDDTPIIDLKPYVPAFDSFPTAKAGWMDRIYDNPLQARERGYQDIQSSRGRRQAKKEKEKE